MRKILWPFIGVMLLISISGYGQKSQRIKVSVGAFSPQKKIILNTMEELGGTDPYWGIVVPNINLSYELQKKSSAIGYGIDISSASNYAAETYIGAHHWNIEQVDPRWKEARYDYDYFHFLIGGSVYFYPDEWVNFGMLGLYTKASFGIEILDVNNHRGYDYLVAERTSGRAYISLYVGARYPVLNWLELQAEIGYRELALMKFGFNIKL